MTLAVIAPIVLLAIGSSSVPRDVAVEVARSHADYARALAALDVRASSDELSWLEDFTGDCGLVTLMTEFGASPEELQRLREKGDAEQPKDATRTQIMSAFRDSYCEPLARLWLPLTKGCVGDSARTPCHAGDGLYESMHLDAYFSALQDLLRDTDAEIERYNIVFVALTSISDHAGLPEPRLGKWYARLMATFSKAASPGDVMKMASSLREVVMPIRWAALRPVIEAYARDARQLTQPQRDQLLQLME